MNDYISRQAAIDDLHTQLMHRMGSDDMKRRLDDWVKTLPSADVVQVVRCKECKHWDNGKLSFECPWDYGRYGSSDEDDFCSYGERKG